MESQQGAFQGGQQFSKAVGDPGPSQPHLPHPGYDPSLIPHGPRELVEPQAFQPRGGGKESHNFGVLSQKLYLTSPQPALAKPSSKGGWKMFGFWVAVCLPKSRGFC